MPWSALQSISLRFKFQQPRLRQLGGHDQLLHLHENWTQRLQRLILDMCSARTCFLPCFPFGMSLKFDFVFSCRVLYLVVVFRFFVLPFCLGPFCSECMRFYSILFPIVLLLLLVLGACLSFLFSLFTRARSHSWLILTFPHSKLPQPSRCLMSSSSEEPHMIMKTPLQAVQQGFAPKEVGEKCSVMPHPQNASSWACLPNKNCLQS